MAQVPYDGVANRAQFEAEARHAAREADWRIAEWPDGTWCDLNALEEYLRFMSDDYRVRRVLAWDESYTPTATEAV